MHTHLIFSTKFYGPTNYKGSRIKVVNTYTGKSKMLPVDCSMNTQQQVREYLTKQGAVIDGEAPNGDNDHFFICTWDSAINILKDA